ncbi:MULTISPECIES: NUDIX hydrolase [Vitreoscilla]|uniref:GDP-mannose pyrophosphatase n=1 Tax=Vitreoscilla stercoraria TaxID=61 RepID=A0ABY4E8V4_VITST|nr:MULTISPECIES: NUDIX hydrolase [Vitreoscilla]AUZ05014.1 ADP-ribose pyrophosphatase [Vitreoscilla sp. C1]UOO91350.1 NUDIX hydrolase [Vitreoscilla stercoraria]
MSLQETLLASQAIFDGKIIKVSVDTVILPNDKTATREVVRHPGAVAVLAVTEHQEVILVRQYRHACGTELLEIPAGKLDIQGEDPSECAFRELAEETPYTAQSMRLIHTFYTVAGFCDEKMYLYVAEGIVQNSIATADEDEFVELVMMNREQVQDALQHNRIADGKTLVALYYWLANTNSI